MGSGSCMVGSRETTQKKSGKGERNKDRRGWKNKPSRADMVVIIRCLLFISNWHWIQFGRNRANRMKITGSFLPQWMFHLSAVSISYGENCSLAREHKSPFWHIPAHELWENISQPDSDLALSIGQGGRNHLLELSVLLHPSAGRQSCS